MIRVRAPSRLHFGLLSFPREPFWANVDGQPLIPARTFGGAGLMIDSPGVCITAQPAAAWSTEGPLARRALTFARQFAETFSPGVITPHCLTIEACPPEHMGLGTGTQLGLAVARSLAISAGLEAMDTLELAQRLGRGQRSAIGIHGFAKGGFLVDGGKRAAESIAPLVVRFAFPEDWRIVLILPPCEIGLHGAKERVELARLQTAGTSPAVIGELSRTVLLGLLPALVDRDLQSFGEALYDYNRRIGQVFAALQGGDYAAPMIEEMITFIRRQGIPGAGQSSWGPATFALVGTEDQARLLVRQLHAAFRLDLGQVICTRANNNGSRIEE